MDIIAVCRRVVAVAAAVCAVSLSLAGCSFLGFGGADASNDANTQTFMPTNGKANVTLNIASGSENKEVAAAIQKAVDSSNVAVVLHYMGSLDVMNVLKAGGESDGTAYDAVWPASSIWISMGDTGHIVKDATSTSTTPVVFGIAKSKAIELGWADASGATKSVPTSDIIAAVTNGDLAFSMTSATQSNSGASAYLAFMTALRGGDQPLTSADLADKNLTSQVKALLSGVDRSSGSSDWLKDMVVAAPDRFDAMVNYESLVIQADKALERQGDDPLLAIYPADGIAVSDSPLGYVDRGQNRKDDFDAFAKALSTKDAKLEFERAGRRTGLGGALAYGSDAQVKQSFRSEWGITTDASALRAISLPAAEVIERALTLYQTDLRKPSWTVWVVDYSGSMEGSGKDGVIRGLEAALDAKQSKASYIEPGDKDVNVLIPFSEWAHDSVTSIGAKTADLLARAKDVDTEGGTDIYRGLEEALDHLPDESQASNYTTAIVLMTDGVSETDYEEIFTKEYRDDGRDLPIFSIMFGQADPAQLKDIAKLSNAKVFDGRTDDLAAVFRQVKGYN